MLTAQWKLWISVCEWDYGKNKLTSLNSVRNPPTPLLNLIDQVTSLVFDSRHKKMFCTTTNQWRGSALYDTSKIQIQERKKRKKTLSRLTFKWWCSAKSSRKKPAYSNFLIFLIISFYNIFSPIIFSECGSRSAGIWILTDANPRHW